MKICVNRLLVIAAMALVLSTSLTAQDSTTGATTNVEAEARTVVEGFVGRLKPRLQQAMSEGGPVHAISVCADEAPAIAARLSEESGWRVKRVSLKPRNKDTAIPDSWERQQLIGFNQRHGNGEAPSSIHAGETVAGEYRYMQAQGVEPVCLACHGTNLAPAVIEALTRYYPDDSATGYQLGEIRGAISLRKTL